MCASWFSWSPMASFQGDYDVLSMLQDEVRWYVLRLTSESIKGHQDNNKATAELPQPAQLNVAADLLAADGLNLPTPPENWVLPGTGFLL